jgi:hypothetical protein
MRIFFLVVVFNTLFCSTAAFAYTRVTGECGSGPIVSVAEIEKIMSRFTDVEDKIIFVGQNLDETLKQGQAKSEKQMDFLIDSLPTLIKEQGVAERTYENDRFYSEASMPRALCEENEISKYLQHSLEKKEKVKEGLVQSSVQFSRETNDPRRSLTRKYNLEPDKVRFNPEGGHLKDEELQEMTKAVNLIIDQVPSLPLEEDEKKRPKGIEYTAAQNMNEILLTIPREVFFDAQSRLATKISDPGIINSLEEMHHLYGTASEPIQIKDGEISYAGLMDFYANIRFASPNWNLDLVSKDPVFLQREQTKMMALILKFAHDILKQEQMQSLMMAQKLTSEYSKDKKFINDYYRKVLSKD